jgi:hypothetical protein
MPWSNGIYTRTNGTFSGPDVWQDDDQAGFGIEDTRHDTHDEDLADGIDQCINKTGQNSPTNDISWGGNIITDLGAGTQPTHSINKGQADGAYIRSDGATIITNDIPFNNKKITGLANAIVGTDALNMTVGDGRYATLAGGNTITDLNTFSTNAPRTPIAPTVDNDLVNLKYYTDTLSFTLANLVHGNLQGLAADDHTQYFNATRGDVRYTRKGAVSTGRCELNGTANPAVASVGGLVTGFTFNTGSNYLIVSISGASSMANLSITASAENTTLPETAALICNTRIISATEARVIVFNTNNTKQANDTQISIQVMDAGFM